MKIAIQSLALAVIALGCLHAAPSHASAGPGWPIVRAAVDADQAPD